MKPYYETALGKLYHGNCLDVMKELETKSVDLVLTDPPYGTTACKWDSIIPLELMWMQLKRLTKSNSAIVMTASQPFTTTLISSNMRMFKYEWIWEKTAATGFLNAEKIPLKAHENVLIFYNQQPIYNPQKTTGHIRKRADRKKAIPGKIYNAYKNDSIYDSTERYPRTVQIFAKDKQKSGFHPTQKPVALMEYLIKTYTNEGDMVLDFTIGSGTTAVACERLNRKWIGIEQSKEYCNVTVKRMSAPIQKELGV